MTQTPIPRLVGVALAWSLMCGAALACGGVVFEPDPKSVTSGDGTEVRKHLARRCADLWDELVPGRVCIEGLLGALIVDQHLVTESCAGVVTPPDRVCVLDGRGRPVFHRVVPIEVPDLTQP